MSANLPSRRRRRDAKRDYKRSSQPFPFLPWLDVLAISAWGILFLKYWLTGQLYLLIHPNYIWLTIAAGVGLLGVAAIKALALLSAGWRSRSYSGSQAGEQHLTLFPPGWSNILLIVTAVLGLVIEPKAFASQTALHRGLTDSLVSTRIQHQSFTASTRPEDRTLIDWIRTLNVYPEPDAYTDQKVKVQGFVVHSPELPKNYILISRFIITCCAADVYPVGLPVKLPQSQEAYKPDSWLEIQGQMRTEKLAGRRQLTIQSTSLKPIPEPKNPYDY